MIVDRQFWFNLGEYLTGLIGSRVIGADAFELLHTFGRTAGRRGNLMDQEIGTAGMFDQVSIERRIAGQHSRAALKIDTIAEGRKFLAAVVDLERADSQPHYRCKQLLL